MRTWALPAGATLLSASYAVVSQALVSRGSDPTLLSNGAQLLAAMLASMGCATGAWRSSGRQRRAWCWLAAGTACWAAGQAVWSLYEVVWGREVPFPSLADVGFLAFPLVAGVGLVVWPGRSSNLVITRGRDVMDGAIIALSLFVLSWVTVMAPLVSANDVSGPVLALSLAYPVGDVVLATLVLLLLSRSSTQRLPLALLAIGLGAFALADSLFSYMTSAGTYTSADVVSSSGWVAGFLLVAAAGMAVSREPVRAADGPARASSSSWLWLALPYVPLVGAGAALSVDILRAGQSAPIDLLWGLALVVLVLVRQFLAMVENHRLLLALGEAGAELEHLATHDALTGLPNRALFADRIDRALLGATTSVSVLFCDLDDFKPINDGLGHAAGDEMLQLVADRLRGCVRPDDTVARLGGDEFAVVLVDCPDPRLVADRVVACMDQETRLSGRDVTVSISVGLVEHLTAAPVAGEGRVGSARNTPARMVQDAAGREVTARRLLLAADSAMYAAKTSGKGRAVVFTADLVAGPIAV